jgi:AraC-like DNA-binding protein
MMPLHNGIAFCQSLKADSRTSHIPLILLTALADQESRLEGLASGADDYLTKPFDPTELLLRAKNLIEQRQKLRHHFSQGFGSLSAGEEADSLDAKFQKKVFSILEEHLDDADFSVEKLSREVGLSKSQLYRKLQALTGLSPNALLQQYRIRHAAELLEKNMATVSEAAYAVGFTNLSYFAKCFREHYGHAPSAHGRLSPNAQDLDVSEK